jgi:hypothetical protein
MAICNISAANNNPSILHGGLFRYYRELGLTGEQANRYAIADWSRVNTPVFKAENKNLLKDYNSEPILFFPDSISGELTDINTLGSEELHRGFAGDSIPVFQNIQDSTPTIVPAVRAKPSALSYNSSNYPFQSSDDIRIFARRLSDRFSIPVEFVTEEYARSLFSQNEKSYIGQPGFFLNRTAYAVEGRVSKSNLIHEIFGHPFIEMLQKETPAAYNAILGEAMSYPGLQDLIRRDYPTEVNDNGAFTDLGKKEILLRALELDAENKLSEVDATGFKSFITRIWRIIKGLLGIKQSEVLNSNSTIGDLTRLALGSSEIDLSTYAPKGLYSTTNVGKETPEQIAKRITDKSLNIQLQQDANGQDKYVNTNNPSQEIRRGTEVVDAEFGSINVGRTREEIAENRSKLEFSKRGLDFSDLTAKITLANGKQYTFIQLKYNYLREYNNARAYGIVGHLLVQMAITKDDSLISQVNEWASKQTLPSDDTIIIRDGFDPNQRFSWLYGDGVENEGGIDDFMFQQGLDDEDGSIKLSEFVLYNEALGIATKPDLVTVYPDGEVGLVDFKFGNIQSGNISRMMNYMELDMQATNRASKLNLAYMQVVIRAFMMKADNPTLKFKNLAVYQMKAGDTPALKMNDFILQDYLIGVKNWMKKTNPEAFKKYENSNLFSAESYYGSTLEQYKMKVELSDHKSADSALAAKDPEKALQILADANIGLQARIAAIRTNPKMKYILGELEEEFQENTKRYLQLSNRTSIPQDITAMTDDLPVKFITDNLNQYDVSIPILVALKDMANERTQERTERMFELQKIHKTLVNDLIDDYAIRVNPAIKTNVKLGETRISFGNIPYYKGDGTGFWDFMFVEDAAPEGQEGQVMRFLSKTRDKTKFNSLSAAQKAYAEWVFKKMGDAYNLSVGNRKVLSEQGKEITKATALGLPTTWNEANSMVFLPMMVGEDKERDPGIVAALARFGKGLATGFIRDDYEFDTKYHAGLPVKYMTLPSEMRQAKAHSLNMEHIFLRFMEHMANIELMEDAYSTSKGVQMMMENFRNQPTGGLHYKNALDYLENYIIQHIESRRVEKDIVLTRYKDSSGEVKKVSINKILEGTRTLTTYSTLWFQPLLAGINTTLITALNFKAAAVNDITAKLAGIKSIDFNTVQLANGIADWTKLKADIVAGTYQNNKLFQLLREFKFSADDFAFHTDKKHMAFVKDGLLDPSHPMFLQALSEDYCTTSLFSALLHSMKVKAAGKEISVWDAYDVQDYKDPDSGKTIKKLNWKAGIRGYIETPFGDTTRKIPVTKLTAEEISALKKSSARLTGDYRQEERGAADMNALWKMAWQFKRFLNRYIKNGIEGRKEDPTLGKYIDSGLITIDEETGKEVPVLKWERMVTEGWGRTMTNYMLCTLMYYNPLGFKRLAAKLNIDVEQFMEKYKWSSLSEFQKLNIGRAVTNTLFLMLGIASAVAFKQRDDDDPLKRRLRRILDDMSEGANIVDILRSGKSPFPAMNKMSNFLQYGTEATISWATGDFTQEGKIRGMRQFSNQFGLTAFLNQLEAIQEAE